MYLSSLTAFCTMLCVFMPCLLVVSQVNAAFPFSSRGHGAPSLSLLQILSINIHPKTETLWEKDIPPLLSTLEGMEM